MRHRHVAILLAAIADARPQLWSEAATTSAAQSAQIAQITTPPTLTERSIHNNNVDANKRDGGSSESAIPTTKPFGDPSVAAADPYDHRWITSFAALGDSYAAGLGAGHALSASSDVELNSDCYQYSYGYPNLLNMRGMLGDARRKMQYLACSGGTINSVKDKQVPKMNPSQLVTLTAGGNDANLAAILNYCVYQWADTVDQTCDGAIKTANETINRDDFTKNMTDLMAAIKPKLAGSNARIYWAGYDKFWNVQTNDCDKVTWAFWWNYGSRQFLTLDRRMAMNSLVDNVNAKIRSVCEDTPQCVFVDPEPDIDAIGGRYCEPGVDETYWVRAGGVSANREQTWFYEWGTTKDNDSDDEKKIGQPEKRDDIYQSLSERDIATEVSNSSKATGNVSEEDLAFETALLYYMGIGLGKGTVNASMFEGDFTNGNEVKIAGSSLPDYIGRVFHLDKFANGVVAARILDAMDEEQSKMMNRPLDHIEVDICSSETIAATTTTTTTAPAQACASNQIDGPCLQASLPSATANSAPRGPVCNKVGSNLVMFNATQASQGVADYCASLISGGVVLSGSTSNPQPGHIDNAAENGGSIALTVMFDVDSCNPNTSSDDQKLDFKAFGQDQCYQSLYTALQQTCEKDPTWGDYNPDFSLEGGVWGGSCALWAMSGLPAS